MARQTDEITIGVIGRFRATRRGREMPIPPAVQRPIAYLAVSSSPSSRATMAERLWPDTRPQKALERLRKAVWRANSFVPDLITINSVTVQLAEHARVDIQEARVAAARLFEGTTNTHDEASGPLFEDDLLIAWDDEWLEDHRQAYHVLRVHALEHLCQHFLDAGQLIDAERLCLATIRDDPFRESVQLLLADVYQAQGNPAKALQRLNEYREQLQNALGLPASTRLRASTEAIRSER